MTHNITIGRATDNMIVVSNTSVSSHHAVISVENSGTISITDQNSTNGTYVNDIRVNKSILSKNDSVKVAHIAVDWQKYLPNQPHSEQAKIVTIGRASDNNLVIAQQDISSHHAKLIIGSNAKIFIEDLNSTNGTAVNGFKISRQQLNRGDQVLLANKYPVKWETYLEDFSETKISAASFSEPKPPVRKKRNNPILFAIASVVLVLIVFGLVFFDAISKMLSPVDYTQKYKNAVVLVYHSYVLEAKVGDEVLLFTMTPEGLDFYDPSINSPVAITGTGFFVSDKGEIITNRHVALPWEYSAEKDQLVEALKKLIRENISTTEDLQYALKTLNDIMVSGKTIGLGVALNETYVNSFDDFIKCSFLKESGDSKIDVALLQINSQTTPSKVTDYFHVDDAITDEDEIKNGMELMLIGYPAGFTLANTNKGIMANCQKGIITRDPDGIDFGHNIPTIGGASGSPIFSHDGRLIGINYQGMTNTQGFNMAMEAKYIKKILE